MTQCYAHLYGLPSTGLRFFTVYGPWGRPDMSAYIFTKAIFEGRPIRLLNHGDMLRDFTYIDDIVAGVLAAAERPPERHAEAPQHQFYNLRHNRTVPFRRPCAITQHALGTPANTESTYMQPGAVTQSAERSVGQESVRQK